MADSSVLIRGPRLDEILKEAGFTPSAAVSSGGSALVAAAMTVNSPAT